MTNIFLLHTHKYTPTDTHPYTYTFTTKHDSGRKKTLAIKFAKSNNDIGCLFGRLVGWLAMRMVLWLVLMATKVMTRFFFWSPDSMMPKVLVLSESSESC